MSLFLFLNLTMNEALLSSLKNTLEGEFQYDQATRHIYATDASAYREMPLAVAMPKNTSDIKKLVAFANEHKVGLIPRAAGTSLAGQVVGSGIVVDVSRHMNQIIEINVEEKWVRVQPGVIRDDLNKHLALYGLLFGPETATANRAMIGGMIGNNSCGSNSIVYGSTREHLLEANIILSDGSEAVLESLSNEEFIAKVNGQGVSSTLEAEIYFETHQILSDGENRKRIEKEFPKRSIPRRNTGYALDILSINRPYQENAQDFNMCKIFAGSEGTLGFLTEAKINIEKFPQGIKGLACIHFDDMIECLKANIIALKYKPTASEIIDHVILSCTKDNIEQTKNRFFVKGDPDSILVVELLKDTEEELLTAFDSMINDIKAEGYGYHYPLLLGNDMPKIWSLRKAGLGLLGNLPGDPKAVPVVEDTAVGTDDLPQYIEEFQKILEKYKLQCMYYAHVGTGEIHIRPILNLKSKEGNELFRIIAQESARLVKKYEGSLSGEHGDGRLRGEFIPQMVGPENFELIRRIKKAWDPNNIFNPGKIVDTPPMNTFLRYEPNQETAEFDTVFDFSKNGGFMREVEKCNGVGECRKTILTGGTMCPSYMATKNEKDTTRARANILREMMTHSKKSNRFDHEEIKEVMDLCLSCKGCKSECPSNIDMARYKAEFQHQYYKSNGVPFRTKMIASFDKNNAFASKLPGLYNTLTTFGPTAAIAKSIMGIAPKRSFPKLHKQTLRKWFKGFNPTVHNGSIKGSVIFFCDEFTNYNDTSIGITAIELLDRLGYQVKMVDHTESGRTMFSKGLLDEARKAAVTNINALKGVVSQVTPLIGLEPSAILTFRDEYPDIVPQELKEDARRIASNSFIIDEFLAGEIDKGNIKVDQFTERVQKIKIHGHCHQKAISSISFTTKILSLPANYTAEAIPSGCCGMAGSFGYEKEHYDVSMKIGELVLFPAVRKAENDVMIAAPGTSCRHQIADGTGKKALHPVEILYEALEAK